MAARDRIRTTVQMLDSILRAAGLRSVAAGNVGLPLVEAVMDPTPYDVFAVELSSFQLHYTESMSAESAAVLNLAEDHLDWYDGPHGMADYATDKGRIYRARPAGVRLQRGRPRDRAAGPRRRRRGRRARDRLHARHARRRDGRRRRPDPGRPRVHRRAAVERGRALHDRRPGQPGAPRRRQRTGRRGAGAGARRTRRPRCATGCAASASTATGSPPSADVDGVTYVDDSKATNPHAARSSLLAYDPVVWVAGGSGQGRALRRAGRGRPATGSAAPS